MMAWKIVKSPEDIIPGSIYQEKVVVISESEADQKKLKQTVEAMDGEFCEVPAEINAQYPLAFAFWANKTDPETKMKDILAGNLRIQI